MEIREIKSSGRCVNHAVKIEVYNASYKGSKMLSYGEIKNSDQSKTVNCPDPVQRACSEFKGNITWYKDYTLIKDQHEVKVRVHHATKDHEGLYTCICTWAYNNKVYNTSGSRELVLQETAMHHLEILTPADESREQFADEGSEIKLNCSVLCGTNVKHDCNASWYINGIPFKNRDGYSQTTKIAIAEPSKNTIVTAILTIKKVSAKDFQQKFGCFGEGYYGKDNTTLTLKRKESIIPLAIGGVCVLFIGVFVAVLVKYFAIDLALFFRPYFPLSSSNKDTSLYDAYVVYQTPMDKITEDRLSQFIIQTLPSVLEDKCGYRLFIHGRDDIPGEDRLELVEECMNQSRRLMVILTPDLGSGSVTTERWPASPQTSVMGGFDWQVGLHHALVQRELSVILIQLGDTGPQQYTHLPPGLQHLIRKSAPLKWPEGSGGAAAWNSRFWKRVRYLMPATPVKKCAQSTIV
ncbi:interleukin-1 receptor-like 1 isoform X2 [Oreochromis aureus]|uniref:interleukin-1 receptor-like 1 isoform X2 n=1 Tax=Oreochromis aureus TaxID=47969 RepID=UPI0019532187|nr:interleukin-1 receptor-like 1 isoform X2 [Oreochromis aureus]